MAADSEDDGAAGDGEQGSGESEWRFSLEEIDARQEGDGNEQADEDDGGNIAGSLERDQPLEPGEINRENALFVALGVLVVVVLIAAVIFGF